MDIVKLWSDVGGLLCGPTRLIQGQQVAQLQVLKQSEGDSSCGYYSLFNIKCLLQASAANAPALAQEALQNMLDRSAYTHYKERLQGLLLQEARDKKSKHYKANPTLWTEEAIQRGMLERTYLAHLKEVGSLDSELVALLEVGMGSLTKNHIPTKAVEAMGQFYGSLAESYHSTRPQAKGLLIGATIHYVGLVVCPITPMASQIIYCDSQWSSI